MASRFVRINRDTIRLNLSKKKIEEVEYIIRDVKMSHTIGNAFIDLSSCLSQINGVCGINDLRLSLIQFDRQTSEMELRQELIDEKCMCFFI